MYKGCQYILITVFGLKCGGDADCNGLEGIVCQVSDYGEGNICRCEEGYRFVESKCIKGTFFNFCTSLVLNVCPKST